MLTDLVMHQSPRFGRRVTFFFLPCVFVPLAFVVLIFSTS